MRFQLSLLHFDPWGTLEYELHHKVGPTLKQGAGLLCSHVSLSWVVI